jgi:hypothetical protein
MNIFIRGVLKILLVTIFLSGAGIGLYIAYDYAVDAAVRRVRAGVTRGIFDVINPLRWPGRIFRGSSS